MQAANHSSGNKAEWKTICSQGGCHWWAQYRRSDHVHQGWRVGTGCNKYGSLGKNNLRRKGEISRPWCHSHEEGKLIPCGGLTTAFITITTKVEDTFPTQNSTLENQQSLLSGMYGILKAMFNEEFWREKLMLLELKSHLNRHELCWDWGHFLLNFLTV